MPRNGNGRGPATKPNEFCTPDLYFAAYLQTAGVELIRHERYDGRIYFFFDTSISNVDELKTAWFNNTGKVAAQPYAHNVKSLKSICHMQ
jgi:hypothetical protein